MLRVVRRVLSRRSVRRQNHRLPLMVEDHRLHPRIRYLLMAVWDHCPRRRSRRLSVALGPLLLVWVSWSACLAYPLVGLALLTQVVPILVPIV
jgi:hypothetical protein